MLVNIAHSQCTAQKKVKKVVHRLHTVLLVVDTVVKLTIHSFIYSSFILSTIHSLIHSIDMSRMRRFLAILRSFFHPPSLHLNIYFLVYLLVLFQNSYTILLREFYFLPFSVRGCIQNIPDWYRHL
jgi:hypothetical protein